MVVAIEPMINRGTKTNSKDGWTILTADGKPSAILSTMLLLSTVNRNFIHILLPSLGIVSNEEDEFRRVPLVL
jgi:methionyl aminopeptidase